MTFVFYDAETTGIDTTFDQILQFGAIRTDENLNEIDRFEIRCMLLPHVVPAPTALKVTGIATENLTDPALPSHYDAMRQLVDEAVSNAFVAYRQAEINAELLAEQSALSGAFLELARKERTLGKRSLIEILAGETAEINAKSDAAEARGSIASTSLALLSAMGILEARHLALE
jgi:DNA polymerase III epsilon subunit-like protein